MRPGGRCPEVVETLSINEETNSRPAVRRQGMKVGKDSEEHVLDITRVNKRSDEEAAADTQSRKSRRTHKG